MPRGVWVRSEEQKEAYRQYLAKGKDNVVLANKERANTEADFWAKVEIKEDDQCWPWKGSTAGGSQYGEMKFQGKGIRSHRLAWQFHHKVALDDGEHVLHKCDYKPCCNPKHLYVGNDHNNALDRAARNQSKGYKLSLVDAEKIRSDTRILREIAEDYGVTIATISNVKRGKNWNHNGGDL